MKKLILALSALLTLTASAGLTVSGYESRHSNLIDEAISTNCGYFRNLEVVSQNSEVIQVDQGIRDVKFTTVLSGEQRLDQNIFDKYEIIVKSEYYDMYDHANKDWGVYEVTSVKCEMK